MRRRVGKHCCRLESGGVFIAVGHRNYVCILVVWATACVYNACACVRAYMDVVAGYIGMHEMPVCGDDIIARPPRRPRHQHFLRDYVCRSVVVASFTRMADDAMQRVFVRWKARKKLGKSMEEESCVTDLEIISSPICFHAEIENLQVAFVAG